MPNRHGFTDEQVEQNVAAYRAFMKGKEVQVKSVAGQGWLTIGQGASMKWDAGSIYRPIPTPRTIPFTRDTLPALPFEIRDSEENRYCVIMANKGEVKTGRGASWFYNELLTLFHFPNGKPCGQEVTE